MLTRRAFVSSGIGAGIALSLEPKQVLAQTASKRVIVDAQVHMWKANTPDRPWAPKTRPQIPEPMTIERILPMMNEAGVDRVVIVPPSLEGDRVDYGAEAAKRYPGRFATMGRMSIDNPKEAVRLAKWRDQPAVLGVRLNVSPDHAKILTDGSADWFWPAAEKAGIPIMFLASGSMPAFAKVAEKHPKLALIIDHMGVSSQTMRDGKTDEAVAETAKLARFPNVSVKVSSIPLFSKQDYPWRDVEPHIKRLYDAYGPQRCHWGTDLTNSFVKATYKQRVTQFTEELKFLSEDDKDWIMGKSLLAKLRWS